MEKISFRLSLSSATEQQKKESGISETREEFHSVIVIIIDDNRHFCARQEETSEQNLKFRIVNAMIFCLTKHMVKILIKLKYLRFFGIFYAVSISLKVLLCWLSWSLINSVGSGSWNKKESKISVMMMMIISRSWESLFSAKSLLDLCCLYFLLFFISVNGDTVCWTLSTSKWLDSSAAKLIFSYKISFVRFMLPSLLTFITKFIISYQYYVYTTSLLKTTSNIFYFISLNE